MSDIRFDKVDKKLDKIDNTLDKINDRLTTYESRISKNEAHINWLTRIATMVSAMFVGTITFFIKDKF